MDAVAHAAAHLRRGGLVAMPTETVYGLAAIARDADGVARVFEAKGRPSDNPLIVHVDSIEMARTCVASWPSVADALARAFWPGPLTLVLPKADWLPGMVTADGPTVAVRMPAHPMARALIEAVGEPLVAPSANRSGYVSPTRVEHVRGVWPEDEVLVLDGGPCEVGLESTVVALERETLRVLRPGAIGANDLANAAEFPIRARDESRPVASPGVVGPHYQPSCPVVLVGSLEEAGRAMDEGPAVVLSPPGMPLAVDPPHASIAMPGGEHEYGRELYAALREADALGAGRIVACVPPCEGSVWEAVRERLSRAAGG